MSNRQTDRQTQRKVALELHKYRHFAMISSADGDQRLTAVAFSAFICKAQLTLSANNILTHLKYLEHRELWQGATSER